MKKTNAIKTGFSVVGAIKNRIDHKNMKLESLNRDNFLLGEIRRNRLYNSFNDNSVDTFARTSLINLSKSLENLRRTFNNNVIISNLQYKLLINRINGLEKEIEKLKNKK